MHVDGTITNHKEIGLGSLLPSWFPDYLFILPSWQAWALMGLDCIHWILQQNLRIQRQSPEQKLCYKARWFYGMVTSRPFTYLEPSIAARSSGASLNRIVGIIKLIPWAKWNVIRHLRWFPNYVWTDLVPSTIISIVSDSQKSKILRDFRFETNSTWPKEPPHLCLYAKTKKCNVCEHGNAKAWYMRLLMLAS